LLLILIENEKKLLNDDTKKLFEDYADRLDSKALKAAIRIAKIRSKLDDDEQAELEIFLPIIDGNSNCSHMLYPLG
jgi:uncharacterized protein (UPF0335 family)